MTELLKQGTRIFQGQEALLKNIDAVKELSMITRTSLGPNGMNKMVINRLGKLFVTNDAATIVSELQVVHPAAKMVQLAAEQQQQEYGDAMNLTMVFCGELLSQAESLIRMGLHPADIIRGFEKAGEKVTEYLNSLVVETVKEDQELIQATVEGALKAAIGSKLVGWVDFFTPLVAKVLPKNRITFNVDNVRTAKILGGALSDSTVIKGAVVMRGAEGTIQRVQNAKVAVYADGITTAKTDAKGTVFIETAAELESYSVTEEQAMEQKIKDIADAGVNLLISGGTIHEMAMHFLEKYNIMVVKTSSKFELRRLCQAIKAQPLIRIAPPTQEQLGLVDECAVEELGSTQITVFRQIKERSQISTIILRGATSNILDDTERALDDGVNVFKKDGRFVPGAGASEIELARLLAKYGESTPGQDQYAIKKYAEAFEVIPRTLAENAGLNATEIISTLYARHEGGELKCGVHVTNSTVSETDILDHLATKKSAISLATNAAITVLKITQIIMAKRSGVNLPSPGNGTMGSLDTDEHY